MQLIDTKTIHQHLGGAVCRPTVHRLGHRGTFGEQVRIGNRVFYRREAVDKALKSMGIDPLPEVADQ